MPRANLLCVDPVRRRWRRLRRTLVVSALFVLAGGAALVPQRAAVDALFSSTLPVPRAPADDAVPGTLDAQASATFAAPPSPGGELSPADRTAREEGAPAASSPQGEGAGSAEVSSREPGAREEADTLGDWLEAIADEAERGLVIAPAIDRSTPASAHFDPRSDWRERLAALARAHAFAFTIAPRLIEIAPPRVEPAPSPEGAGAPAATSSRVLRPLHARAAEIAVALSQPARRTHVELAADKESNAVVLLGPEPAVERIEALAWALDRPRRRFVLEAEIVELSTSVRRELGVRWSVDGTVGGIVDFPAADDEGEGAGIIVASDGAHALRARIGALESDGRVRIVSRPRVVVLEGRPAAIESVRILRVRFPDRTSVVGEIDDGALGGERAVEEIPVGVSLRVEPSMHGDGRIVLRIRAKSSTLGPPQPPDGIPEELSRMVDAEIAVADGQTAVLGGLLREGTSRSSAGVPVLRSIPLVGALFGKRERERDGEELVIFVTPRVLRD